MTYLGLNTPVTNPLGNVCVVIAADVQDYVSVQTMSHP
jgi:hypothetical protein